MTSPQLTFDQVRQRLFQAPSAWVRPLVIASVLVISTLLPFVASATRLMLLSGVLITVAATLVFIQWPPLGLLLLIIVGLIMPSPELPGHLNIAVLLVGLLLGLWLLDKVIRRERRQAEAVVSRTTR